MACSAPLISTILTYLPTYPSIQVLDRLFPAKARSWHGNKGQKLELVRCAECLTGSLKRLTRERSVSQSGVPLSFLGR